MSLATSKCVLTNVHGADKDVSINFVAITSLRLVGVRICEKEGADLLFV